MERSSLRRSSVSELPPSRKRAKYTQLACNECKRRKLKCDGKPVCSRCIRQNAQCVYTPSSHAWVNAPATPSVEVRDDGCSNRFRTVDQQMEIMRREMRVMSARIRELESASATTPSASNNTSIMSSAVSTGLQRIMNRPDSPDYVGPTSAEFGIAQRRKQADESDGDESEPTTAPSPAALSDVEAMSNDPLGSLGKEEALRLVTVYENNVGVMYPCIDLDSLRSYMNDYFKDEDRSGPTLPGVSDQNWFFARDAEVLKILLATALLAESHGRSERAALLADSVEDRFATRLKIPEVDMKELLILTLLSIFHSYRDDEVISWRIIGLAVRGSMQLGLHRQETWLRTGGIFLGELQWTFASRLFWCIYVLDRKWSFGTGLPFAIQDSDMDTNLPEPGAATPYLTCLISYSRLSTKIWGLVMGWRSRPKAATSDYCSYLNFQVQQWTQSIPRELRFEPGKMHTSDPESTSRITMLQVLLALQANQLRVLVYRQNLLSSDSIESDTAGASIAVETAKSTVHMLEYFSRVSDIYFQRPEPFNYFLISALAAFFLAVLHAPSRFSQVCRPEFYTAVDMVRRSSTRAHTSRRLQKIIGNLKLICLNLDSRPQPPRRSQKQQQKQQQQQQNQTPTPEPGSTSGSYPTGTGLGYGSRTRTRTTGMGMGTPSVDPSPSSMSFQGHDHGNPHIQPGLPHSSPGILTPQPSVWPISTPLTATRTDENSCEDLTNFFEMAGGLYFDPRVDPSIGNTLPSQAGLSDALGAFEAEDEALTKVMAGLL